jgi:hypothetical protein
VTQTPPSANPKGPIILSILIVTVGIGRLLTALAIGPGINWVWSLGLAVVGLLSFAVGGGLDKWNIVIGPFFLVACFLSILRQRGMLNIEIEVPILLIVFGILLFFAQSSVIPLPRWYISPPDQRK